MILAIEPLELQKTHRTAMQFYAVPYWNQNRIEIQCSLEPELLESDSVELHETPYIFMQVLAVPVQFLQFRNCIELLELRVLAKTAGIRTTGIAKAAGIGTIGTAGIGTAGTVIKKSWNRPCLQGAQV